MATVALDQNAIPSGPVDKVIVDTVSGRAIARRVGDAGCEDTKSVFANIPLD